MPLFATRRSRDLAAGLLLLLVYVVVGKLGLRLAFAYPSATPVWPATGLALAAFLRFGRRVWPAVFLGAFIVNETTAGTIATSVLIAAGNTLEALTGAWLIERYAGGRTFFLRADGIFKFTILAALVSTAISATIGVLTLRVAGLLPADATHSAWITWWLGDASGDLLVAPVLLSWATLPRWRPTRAEALEALALFVTLPIVGIALFGSAAPFERSGAPPTFFGVPLLIWAAVRLGFRKASTATLLLATIAVWGTLHGHGGFVRGTPNASLLLLQAYMAVASVMTMTLAAAVVERKAAEEKLRTLAISDPLTGIANYRHLIDVLGQEIGRSQRTGRPFALLFLDVDGLKKINDRHGHIVGSRALTRVAEVLRASARAVDTAARYGGDEFALLLPETAEPEAWQVGRRISERLAADAETPPVRVSLGLATYPRDGADPESLLGMADTRLYQARSRSRGEAPFPGAPGVR